MKRPILALAALVAALSGRPTLSEDAPPAGDVLALDNLVAWCIVPFDSKRRGPEERADLVRELGLSKVAYDWRAEHVASFEAEIEAYRERGIEFFAFWSWHDALEPLIEKHGIRPQVWITAPSPEGRDDEERIDAAARQLEPLVRRTAALGLRLGLYNHGGWGGEPRNLVAVCERLRAGGAQHVGIVYNFHHGHDHIEGFAARFAKMAPYLLCLNVNGMNDRAIPKILPVGDGAHERAMLRAVVESGWRGPVGVLGHQAERDVEVCLRENLAGVARVRAELRAERARRAVVWIGTTTPRDGASRGIYRAELDLESGALSEPVLAAEASSPGFLALHPGGRVLYAVCRLEGGGGVAAYEISPDRRSLRPLGGQLTGDGGATHLAVDATGRCLYTVQYGGGSVAVFPLDAEGRIQPRSQLIEHSGSGPNAARQEAPHPHWVGLDPGNRFVFVPDLGIDRVVIYRADLEKRRLTPHGEGVCPPGGGPRHMKFHPGGRFAYVLQELGLEVTAFRYDPEAGALEPFQSVSSLPEELREVPNKASEIRVDPRGRFVWAANRGHDTIACFRVDPTSGGLSFVEREPIRGAWPRNFGVDPTGRWVLAAGRDSATIAVFEVDSGSGGLVFTGRVVACPTPICVEMQIAD